MNRVDVVELGVDLVDVDLDVSLVDVDLDVDLVDVDLDVDLVDVDLDLDLDVDLVVFLSSGSICFFCLSPPAVFPVFGPSGCIFSFWPPAVPAVFLSGCFFGSPVVFSEKYIFKMFEGIGPQLRFQIFSWTKQKRPVSRGLS